MLFLYHSNITVVFLAFSGSVGVSCAAAIPRRLSKHCKNNYICLQDDGEKKKKYGSLTEEAVNLSQMNSSSKCLLSGIHRRNNYSPLGQTARSSQQSSILGWQE